MQARESHYAAGAALPCRAPASLVLSLLLAASRCLPARTSSPTGKTPRRHRRLWQASRVFWHSAIPNCQGEGRACRGPAILQCTDGTHGPTPKRCRPTAVQLGGGSPAWPTPPLSSSRSQNLACFGKPRMVRGSPLGGGLPTPLQLLGREFEHGGHHGEQTPRLPRLKQLEHHVLKVFHVGWGGLGGMRKGGGDQSLPCWMTEDPARSPGAWHPAHPPRLHHASSTGALSWFLDHPRHLTTRALTLLAGQAESLHFATQFAHGFFERRLLLLSQRALPLQVAHILD